MALNVWGCFAVLPRGIQCSTSVYEMHIFHILTGTSVHCAPIESGKTRQNKVRRHLICMNMLTAGHSPFFLSSWAFARPSVIKLAKIHSYWISWYNRHFRNLYFEAEKMNGHFIVFKPRIKKIETFLVCLKLSLGVNLLWTLQKDSLILTPVKCKDLAIMLFFTTDTFSYWF